jgi:hypothetical protein
MLKGSITRSGHLQKLRMVTTEAIAGLKCNLQRGVARSLRQYLTGHNTSLQDEQAPPTFQESGALLIVPIRLAQFEFES